MSLNKLITALKRRTETRGDQSGECKKKAAKEYQDKLAVIQDKNLPSKDRTEALRQVAREYQKAVEACSS